MTHQIGIAGIEVPATRPFATGTRAMARVVVVLWLLAFLPALAGAQGLRSLEGNVGLAFGQGTNFHDRAGPALDALVSFGIRPQGGGMLVGAVNVGVTGVAGGDSCRILPDGGCMPDFPALAPIALLVGLEAPSRVARISAGPAVVMYDDEGGRGGATGGLAARVDLLTPAPFHFALVLSARALLLPSYRGRMASQLAAGVGLAIR